MSVKTVFTFIIGVVTGALFKDKIIKSIDEASSKLRQWSSSNVLKDSKVFKDYIDPHDLEEMSARAKAAAEQKSKQESDKAINENAGSKDT